MSKTNQKKFTLKEDEVIKHFVEYNAHNLQEAFRDASFQLNRKVRDIEYRYYRMRGRWRILHTLIDNNESTFYNTKNVDMSGKFRRDLTTKQKKISLNNCSIFKEN